MAQPQSFQNKDAPELYPSALRQCSIALLDDIKATAVRLADKVLEDTDPESIVTELVRRTYKMPLENPEISRTISLLSRYVGQELAVWPYDLDEYFKQQLNHHADVWVDVFIKNKKQDLDTEGHNLIGSIITIISDLYSSEMITTDTYAECLDCVVFTLDIPVEVRVRLTLRMLTRGLSHRGQKLPSAFLSAIEGHIASLADDAKDLFCCKTEDEQALRGFIRALHDDHETNPERSVYTIDFALHQDLKMPLEGVHTPASVSGHDSNTVADSEDVEECLSDDGMRESDGATCPDDDYLGALASDFAMMSVENDLPDSNFDLDEEMADAYEP